ncbi:MAG TPA: LacI family DNA-binding transcriptional regulator [Bryobacteraceae bacterium]|nr:LacI family DNA-binding transcriptional regulator [Bryobacteraceae bacterium]
MATMKQVAERAGVSVATVSYVLNDTRKVRPETEQRVLSAAKELGYSPNTAARSLVVGRSSMVGLIVPDLGNPFFPEITKAFQDAAGLAGLETIVMNTNYDLQRTRNTVDRLVSLQVPGAAFLTSQVDPTIRQALSNKEICAVYLDHGVSGPHISNIAIDYARGIQAGLAHLLELGHRRIGYIGGPAGGSAAQRRKDAFVEGATRASVEFRAVDSDFSVQGGYFSCSKLLNDFAATAVMAANDMMAIGAMHSAYDRKITVPSELSVIGFDDITFAQYTQPALTTIAVPRTEVGRLAFHSLWTLVTDPGQAGAEYEVKTGLVIRQTTAPPRQ